MAPPGPRWLRMRLTRSTSNGATSDSGQGVVISATRSRTGGGRPSRRRAHVRWRAGRLYRGPALAHRRRQLLRQASERQVGREGAPVAREAGGRQPGLDPFRQPTQTVVAFERRPDDARRPAVAEGAGAPEGELDAGTLGHGARQGPPDALQLPFFHVAE